MIKKITVKQLVNLIIDVKKLNNSKIIEISYFQINNFHQIIERLGIVGELAKHDFDKFIKEYPIIKYSDNGIIFKVSNEYMSQCYCCEFDIYDYILIKKIWQDSNK